ncbi:hypothetical protein D3C75_780500 [compost metagenome]
MPTFACRLLQGFRLELLLEEVVAVALVHQQRRAFAGRGLGQQHAGIPLAPARTVFTQVAAESFLAPRAIHRVADRRERRHRSVAPRVAQGAHQRAMPTHGVATDAALARSREVRLDQRGQLLHHIVVHAVVLGPRLLSGIEVEAGTQAEVPGTVRVARHLLATRAGVGGDDDQPKLCGQALGAGLLHEVLVGAGEAAEPVQHRQLLALFGLRRQVDGEHHVAAQHLGVMPVTLVPAAEALLAGDVIQAHGKPQKWITLRMLLPSCIRSKALLMSSRPMVWVMKVSSGISPFCAFST